MGKAALIDDDTELENTKQVWKDSLSFVIYELAKLNVSESKMAVLMGVSKLTLRRWKKDKRLVRLALKAAEKFLENNKAAEQKRTAFYQALPKELQDVWSDMLMIMKEGINPLRKIDYILRDKGTKARQHLFFHALVELNMNVNAAMRINNLDKKVIDYWIESDFEFAGLFNQIKWYKQNFYEAALIRLVDAGDSAATIFANKTYNRDRGYNEKHEIQINGAVQHTGFSLDDLLDDLSVEAQSEILEAIRKRNSRTAAIDSTSNPLAITAQ